jgi:hypothetical protein
LGNGPKACSLSLRGAHAGRLGVERYRGAAIPHRILRFSPSLSAYLAIDKFSDEDA